MEIKEKRNFSYFLLFLNALFLIYYIVLAIHARPHYDDLHFLWKMKELSISEYVMDMYYSRSGRFIGYALNGIVFSTINFVNAQWFFPIVFWLIGVWLSVYGILKLSNQKFSFININAIVLIYNVFVLTNIDFAVFNWLCAMSYYILAPAMLALVALLISKKTNAAHLTFIGLLSIFLGGGQEAFTPIVLLVIFSIVVGIWYKHKFNFALTFRSVIVQKSMVSLFVMALMLLIVVIAPGNYKRLAMDEFNKPEGIVGYVKGFANAISMFFYYLVFYFPYYLMLALIVTRILFGKFNTKFFQEKKYLMVSIISYFVYLILSVFPSVYLWGGFGIQRNYTHLVFVTILFFIYCMFYLFVNYQPISQKLLNKLAFISVIILSVIMIFNIYYDSKSSSRYAKAVDNRIELALKHNASGNVENLIVSPLPVPYTIDVKYNVFKLLNKKSNPQPVLYYISDTETNANEYASHFRKYYRLNFDIVLQP